MFELAGLLTFIIGLALAITIHEAAHCFAADYLGDPTPRSLGRTTLNPKAHLDPIGFGLPVLLRLMGSPLVFGWGKPAPFDPYNLTNPRRDTALIALAGPTSNLVLAAILSVIAKLIDQDTVTFMSLVGIISMNISLALFNLLPVPPLDGAKILSAFLSHEQAYRFESFAKTNSTVLLFLIIFPIFGGFSLASLIISPVYNALFRLFLG